MEGEGEGHQARWKFKAHKSPQHLMMKYDCDGDGDGVDDGDGYDEFDSPGSIEDHLTRAWTRLPC